MSRKTWFVLAWLLLLGPRPAGAEPFQPAWRPAADLGGGIVGVVGGATGVGGLAYFASRLAGVKDVCGHECFVPPTLNWGLGGALLGGIAGTGLGTWAAGRYSGGDGALWATYAGEGVGLAVASLLMLTDAIKNYEPVAFVALSVVGAVVGYELSSNSQASVSPENTQQPRRGLPVAMVPVWFGFLRF